jgi:hypothetical protein
VAAGRAETVYSSGAVGMAIRRGYPGHAHGCFKSFKGGVTGAVTAGIGEKFGAVGGGFKTFGQKLGHELGRAMTHATAQTAIGLAFGDQNPGATYAAGFAGSMVGSGLGAAFEGKKFANAAQILGSGAVSGATAELTGGNFWGGFAQGAITSWANHVLTSQIWQDWEKEVLEPGEDVRKFVDRKYQRVKEINNETDKTKLVEIIERQNYRILRRLGYEVSFEATLEANYPKYNQNLGGVQLWVPKIYHAYYLVGRAEFPGTLARERKVMESLGTGTYIVDMKYPIAHSVIKKLIGINPYFINSVDDPISR